MENIKHTQVHFFRANWASQSVWQLGKEKPSEMGK